MIELVPNHTASLPFPIWRLRLLPGTKSLIASSATNDETRFLSVDDSHLGEAFDLLNQMPIGQPITDLDYSPTNRLLALCTFGRSARFYFVADERNGGHLTLSEFVAPTNVCNSLKILDSSLFVSNSDERATELIDLCTWKKLGVAWWGSQIVMHPEQVIGALVIRDQGGGRIHFVCVSDSVQSYSLLLEAHPNIAGICFSPDGTKLGVACGVADARQSTLRYQIYDFPSCRSVWKFEVPCDNYALPEWYSSRWHYPFPTERFILNVDGSKAICPLPNGDLAEFDTISSSVVAQLKGHRTLVTSVDVDRSSHLLVAGCGDGIITVWQLDETYGGRLSSRGIAVTTQFRRMYRVVSPFAEWPELYSTDGLSSFGNP
jgi:WD40 repeat protein